MAVQGVLSHSPFLKSNNFDLLRLALAGIVCLVHAYQLSGFEQLTIIGQVLSSDVAVKAFFIVSGFLIFMSYDRSKSVKDYFTRRLRRIYPAYVVIILLCAFLLYFASSMSASEYFSIAWLKYIAVNLIFLNALQPNLPGVFEQNSIAAVNGALWTLKIEVMFYLAVPVLVWGIRRFGKGRVLAFSYVASAAYFLGLTYLATQTENKLYGEMARQLPGQLWYFISGAALYYYLPIFERYRSGALIASIVVLLASRFIPMQTLYPAALACIVIYLALFTPVVYKSDTDLSYGVYILHFPIIQLMLSTGHFDNTPWLFLILAMVGSSIGALFMWNLIEKRFIRAAVQVRVEPQQAAVGQGV